MCMSAHACIDRRACFRKCFNIKYIVDRPYITITLFHLVDTSFDKDMARTRILPIVVQSRRAVVGCRRESLPSGAVADCHRRLPYAESKPRPRAVSAHAHKSRKCVIAS